MGSSDQILIFSKGTNIDYASKPKADRQVKLANCKKCASTLGYSRLKFSSDHKGDKGDNLYLYASRVTSWAGLPGELDELSLVHSVDSSDDDDESSTTYKGGADYLKNRFRSGGVI